MKEKTLSAQNKKASNFSMRLLLIITSAVTGLTLLVACGGEDQPAVGSDTKAAGQVTTTSSQKNTAASGNKVSQDKYDICAFVTAQEFETIWGSKATSIIQKKDISDAYDGY